MQGMMTREGVNIFYRDDYFGEPWRRDEAQTVVLVHGIGESSDVWYAWMHGLTDRYRVIRLDLPGHGRSTLPAETPYDWTPERLAADLAQFVDALGLRRFHLVGAKYGGSIVVRYAAEHGERLTSLSVVSGPVQVAGTAGADTVLQSLARVQSAGLRTWVEESMDSRLGRDIPAGQRRWWTDLMASTDKRTICACLDAFARINLRAELARIRVPTRFVTTRGNALMALDAFQAWAADLPDSGLTVLEADTYHPAATHPREAMEAVRRHIAATAG
ncbi:MAG TPA: alpha/beta hydrolase [Burkholderiaceae bacterium]|nr:alpha/beta hydrolase [Burkholderiaceae bacterium]